jgi:UDP-N-acetylglucosamine 2-epimerase (non-hydrolysing)
VQEKEKYVLITAHRRESWGPKMREIFLAIARLARLKPEVRFELATHTNPIVADDAEEILSSIPNVSLLKHQSYADFVQKMAGAELILSDSGGIQEEGPSLGVPVLVLRDKTEYQELIDAGLILLAGTDKEGIEDTFLKAFADRDLQQKAQAFARIRSSESSVKLIVERLATLEASA